MTARKLNNRVIDCFSSRRLLLRLLTGRVSGFRAYAPRVIDLELTNRCNLRCRMCWFYGESGVGDAHRGKELSRDDVFLVIDQAAKFDAAVYLGGAEPLVRNDFVDILKYIKARGLRVSFTTNGVLLDAKMIEAIVSSEVHEIIFSVDGMEQLHDDVRGRGTYRQVVGAIRELSMCRERRGSTKPSIGVNMTVSAKLVTRVKESIRAIADATRDGVDSYRIHQLWFITPQELRAHQAATRQFLGCSSPGAASHLIPRSQVPDPRLLAKEILGLNCLPKIRSFPDLVDADLLKYYADGESIDQRCVAPYFGVVIKPNGDVKFCPDEWIDDYILGNVRDNSLKTIWNNSRARLFRSALFRQKCFPACKRCSFMYAVR